MASPDSTGRLQALDAFVGGNMMPPRRLLIVKPSSFGDIVHALPVPALLKRRWPQTLIDWLVKEEWTDLLIGHPALHGILHFPKTLSQLRELRRCLDERRYDMVIDLQGLLRSGIAALLTRARERVGFADGREGSRWCYTKRVQCRSDAIHAVDRNIDLLCQLGIPTDGPVTFPLTVPLSAEARVEALWEKEWIAHGEKVVIVHPAARGETKRWPADRFAQVIDHLASEVSARIILVAGREQVGHVEDVIERVRRPVINLAGTTSLLELAALSKKASLVISNDSGPMHLAAAVGTPVIGLFGPTDPRRVGPYGPDSIALKNSFDCSSCSRTCCARDQGCLKSISVDEVLTAAARLLRRPQTRREVSESSGAQ